MIELLRQPWHWAFSGFMIVAVMFLLIWLGRRFGVSSSFRAICALGGAGKAASYFKIDTRNYGWLLAFVVGSIIGGFLASTLIANPEPIALSQQTLLDLGTLQVDAPGGGDMVPANLFNFDVLMTPSGLLMFVGGGFLIGFGTRWAGGCTSGHAISGLSNLQLPSLVAVVGFFIGGLIATHLLYPVILT